jgi:PAS domain S-box-containing protein
MEPRGGTFLPLASGWEALGVDPATTTYVGLLVLTLVIAIGVGAVCLVNRDVQEARWLFVGQIGVLIWTGCVLAATLLAGTPWAILLWRCLFVGLGIGVMALALFALSYSGRDELISQRLVGGLSIHPIALTIAVATDHWHGLFLHSLTPADPGYLGIGYDITVGPLFTIHTLYSYVLILVSLVIMLNAVIRANHLYQRQVAAVVVGVGTALFANVLFFLVSAFGQGMRDLTPIAFGFMGLCFAYAIFRFDFIDLGPAAWDVIVERLSEGICVVDEQGRVVDANRTWLELTGVDADVVGEPAQRAFGEHTGLCERFADPDEDDELLELETDNETHIVDLEQIPVSDHRNSRVGRAFIARDITERARRQRELERNNEKLDQFATLISHDLRNPLNVAQGNVELAEQSGDPEHFDAVRRALDRMGSLIRDVLTLTRRTESELETEPIAVRELVQAAWDTVETTGAVLDLDVDCRIEADRGRLHRALENLFRNAIQHSDGRVTVRVGTVTASADGSWGIFVADDGPGIPEAEQADIFEGGFTTHRDGTGLGLSIVDNAVTAHDWEIHVTDSETGGARFEITGIDRLSRERSQPARLD